jgi:hypothetical protein
MSSGKKGAAEGYAISHFFNERASRLKLSLYRCANSDSAWTVSLAHLRPHQVTMIEETESATV